MSVEGKLLDAARGGDEHAFARLLEPYRPRLHAHCYRMLASRADAEDAMQEALLAAWRGLPRFEGRSSLRTWLYTVATNTCLRAAERRPKRVLPIDYGAPADPHDRPREPLAESVWIGPYPDEPVAADSASPEGSYRERENVELAFVAALQHLPARQRATLILRDVLGFSAREAAEALGTTPVSIDSALQRAHKTVDARLPEHDQQATLRMLDDADLKRLVEGYVDAWERADIDALVGMLADDAVLAMPPEPHWFAGREAVATFLARFPFGPGRRWRVVPTRANGQLAFGHYVWREEAAAFVRGEISVVSVRGREIDEIVVFRTPDSFEGFDLPERIDDRSHGTVKDEEEEPV